MGVKVSRNLTHLTIDRPVSIAKALGRSHGECMETMLHDRVGWHLTMTVPHHHGHAARFAVGDPTNIIGAVPVGEAVGLTQLAVRIPNKRVSAIGPAVVYHR